MIPWRWRIDSGDRMRGEDRTSGTLFSYVDVEARIAAKHPLRAMRGLTDAALADLDRAFSSVYVGFGRRAYGSGSPGA